MSAHYGTFDGRLTADDRRGGFKLRAAESRGRPRPSLTGLYRSEREVSTWSEEWRHECEVAFLAGLTLAQRNQALEGEKDGMRGMKSILGDAAVARKIPHCRSGGDRTGRCSEIAAAP